MLNFSPKFLLAEAIDQYTWASMHVRQNPSSHGYLIFAKEDLKNGNSPRNLVNSISNAKRALHLRMEDLCLGFGSKDLNKLKKFPLLLDYLRSCGIVTPNILSRLNSLRNAVEHDYDIPELSDVETFVDVTELFLVATDRWIDRQPCDADYFQEVEAGSGGGSIVGLSFNWKEGVAKINYLPKDAESRLDMSIIEYRSPSDEYFACVRFLLANNY